MTEPCIAAIDGGGTKTLLVVLYESGRIGTAIVTGGSNPFDQPLWGERLGALLGKLPTEGVQAVSLGLAGYGESDRLRARQRALVAEALGPTPHCITNDVDMACTGAFGGNPGVLLLSGTGSMAWGAVDGVHCRVGGWGSLFGDEGSAYWIGCQALRMLSALLDGRNQRDTDFLLPFVQAMGFPTDPVVCKSALLEWYGGLDHPRSSIAALSQLVAELAGMGCSPAKHILDSAAEELAAHVLTVRRKLDDSALPWSYAGGALQSAYLRQCVADRCGQPVDPILPPIGGGLIAAARLANWDVDLHWLERVDEALSLIRPERAPVD